MPLNTLQRSILKELTLTLLLATVALNFILMTENLLKLTKLFATVGASVWDVMRIIVLLQPQALSLTAPMAFFISTLLVYGRLNAESEITAMRAAGMSFEDISKPVFMLGMACLLLGFAVSFYVAPSGSRKVRTSVAETIAARAHYAVEEGIFNTMFKDVVIFVREKPSENTLGGIFIYDERKKGQPRALFARSGSISGDGQNISLDLRGGQASIVSGKSSTGLSFGRYHLMLPVEFEKPSRKYSELPPPQLLKEAASGDEKRRLNILIEFWRRLTLPVLSVVFVFLGPPLALRSGKTGRLGGLTIGLSVFILYYIAMVYAENLVRGGSLPHYAGAWLPALVLMIFALWMFRKETLR